MAPVIRIFSVLFVAACVINTLPLDVLYNSFVGAITYQFGVVLIVLYFATFGLERLRNRLAGKAPIYFDYVTLVVSISLLSIILGISGGVESKYKILFLPTVLFYTVRFGIKWGFAASTMTAFTLTAANVAALIKNKDLNLEHDIVYIGVYYLVSWLVGSMVDMERAISDRLSMQVNVDDLTGLYSHRFLREELKRRTGKETAVPFALAMVSLDYFRYYAETHGHQASEKLMIEVAESIVDGVGNAGDVFRFGCDGFAVIIDDCDREKALNLAERIRRVVKARFTIDDPNKYWEYKLTASLGLAFYPSDGKSREDLIGKADQALYKAKMISGNKVETYYSVMEFLKAQVDASEEDAFNKLSAFLSIINARDQYTYGHSERVLIYASIIATLLGMPPPAKKYLQYGAYLHDIGKIEINRSVLNYPGKLSDEEWEIMTKHPLWGADIARQIKALHPAIPPILYHHERYDGSGYPYKLRGKDIPLEGRIMALADSFDAMTVERPYRKAIPYENAIAELERNCLNQFDPDMVNLFTGFLRQYQSVGQLLTPRMQEIYLL